MTETENDFDNMVEDTKKEVTPTVDNYSKQIEILVEKRDKKMKNFDFAKAKGFHEWEANMEPEQGQIEALVRKSRLIAVSELEDIPSYGDHMRFEDFKECCDSGGFIDYDGSGNYATKDKMSSIGIWASDITEGVHRTDFTHVVWFNK